MVAVSISPAHLALELGSGELYSVGFGEGLHVLGYYLAGARAGAIVRGSFHSTLLL